MGGNLRRPLVCPFAGKGSDGSACRADERVAEGQAVEVPPTAGHRSHARGPGAWLCSVVGKEAHRAKRKGDLVFQVANV